MIKRKKKLSVTVTWILFIIFPFLATFSSCDHKEIKLQVERMDTLEHILGNVGDVLNIDENAVSMRLDTIRMKLNVILKSNPDSNNLELKNAIVKYQGIASIYEEFLKEYPIVDFDADKHARIVKDLRKKVETEKLSESEFNESYQREKGILEAIEKKARDLSYRIYSVEKDYWRSSEKINPVYYKIVKT